MIRTRVGYTGGTLENPTYRRLGDHTETVQIDFDPAKTSFEKIMEIYWSTHNHCATPNSRQYMSAVFFGSEEQKKIAIETRDRAAAKLNRRITTSILSLGEFYLAEDYHQKYALRQRSDVYRELVQMLPSDKDFMASTAAARINGYLGSEHSYAQLEAEIDSFGLSPEGRAALLNLVKTYGKK